MVGSLLNSQVSKLLIEIYEINDEGVVLVVYVCFHFGKTYYYLLILLLIF
jgi:hypothetical protein